ncbi:fluoride efflux transporter CrcB [Antarcticibacterium sp. 1MA-6-2]|uniref:fluoride efflux transporter CrcB n=1 Tax=Antarcticibacterium sp. 1MA-6-2 TaxID=2908210 RepID=UPI001F335A5E|nr:fluoride efflux transporter CrcB [Antarcticibacterium sp. 1MA-6-2]UJH92591.1 fluoride efflux transporter CrcB [Antarcticibacterium sp. 1MA-6-2]
MKSFFLVFLGGGLGSVLRYSIYRVMQSGANTSILSTLSVNVIGSLFLGLVMGYTLKESTISNNLIIFLTMGVCGGFTTFSTFAFENKSLLSTGEYFTFFLYAFGSLLLGILAIFLGMSISRYI